MAIIDKLKRFLSTDLEDLANPQKNLTKIKTFSIFCIQTVRSIGRHQTMTMSSALAFKTLMAIVPLILIGIAVASALGSEGGQSYSDSFFTAIEDKIPNTPFLKPLLNLLREISVRAREIAGVGLILLFITAYSLLSSVEWAFNRIWQVSGKRKILNRIVSYLATIIIVPVLMTFSVYINARIETATEQVASSIEDTKHEAFKLFGGLSSSSQEQTPTPESTDATKDKTATTDNQPPKKDQATTQQKPTHNAQAAPNNGQEQHNPAPGSRTKDKIAPSERTQQAVIVKIVLGVISIVMSCIALTALFFFMPFTPVKFKAALYGGLLCGVMIELLKYFYSYYAMHASTNLTRLYGSTLLALPLTLLWLWLVWTFILMGAEISFNLQNYKDLAISDNLEKQGLNNRLYLAVRIVLLSSEFFNLGKRPVMFIDEAASRLRVPPFIIRTLVLEMVEKEILREVTGIKDAYLPARDLCELTVYDVVKAISSDRFTCEQGHDDEAHRIITAMFDQTSARMRTILNSKNMHQLLEEEGFIMPHEEVECV